MELEAKPSLVCEQKTPCPNPPVARIYWPGDKARVLCLEHVAAAQNIMEAMGMHLVVEEL